MLFRSLEARQAHPVPERVVHRSAQRVPVRHEPVRDGVLQHRVRSPEVRACAVRVGWRVAVRPGHRRVRGWEDGFGAVLAGVAGQRAGSVGAWTRATENSPRAGRVRAHVEHDRRHLVAAVLHWGHHPVRRHSCQRETRVGGWWRACLRSACRVVGSRSSASVIGALLLCRRPTCLSSTRALGSILDLTDRMGVL